MTTDLLANLDVFHGDLTVNRAYVYARLPRPADDAGLSLVGQVRGPRCKLAETLPVTSPLVDLGPGPTLLAQALLPDPVFWSPDLPAIYDVTVNLLHGTEIIATARRQIGLRSFGVRGRNLFLNGKRWVLRGVSPFATSPRPLQEWHEVQAAYVNDDSRPDDLMAASECGVLALIHVYKNDLVPRIRRLAQYPGVAIVATEPTLPTDFRKSLVAPNIILAQRLSPVHWLPRQPWADLLLVCADASEDHIQATGFGEMPIIAARYEVGPPEVDLATARAACDTLQRDLAPLGQFAGYVV